MRTLDLPATCIADAKLVAARAKAPGVKLVLQVREEDYYLACSPRTAPVPLKTLGAALESMQKDGSYDKIVKSRENR